MTRTNRVEKVILAEPRGFCAGVEMAIKALTTMVRVFEPPVYCYHQIVHNQWVVKAFEAVGVRFVSDLAEVPTGAPVMLSAHGSAPEVRLMAEQHAGVVIDAVCPLVTKVHHEVKQKSKQDFSILYVGHAGHDEAIGTIAVAPENITLIDPDQALPDLDFSEPGRVALLAQTTLGQYEWEGILRQAQERFPQLWTARSSDLCYATTNRQQAVSELAQQVDLLVVIGSENSSNTQALVRVGENFGVRAVRIDRAEQLTSDQVGDARVVGITAGASAPDHLVTEVIERLAPELGWELFQVTSEDEYFPLPPGLRRLIGNLQTLVQASLTAHPTTKPGWLDRDREWTATAALASLAET